jgi:hypothetical protein
MAGGGTAELRALKAQIDMMIDEMNLRISKLEGHTARSGAKKRASSDQKGK